MLHCRGGGYLQVVSYKGCLNIFISNTRNGQVTIGLACRTATIVFLVHFSKPRRYFKSFSFGFLFYKLVFYLDKLKFFYAVSN